MRPSPVPMRRAALTHTASLMLVLCATLTGVAGPPPEVVRVEMSEFAFRPSVLRLTSGRPARLLFENRGQIAHQFESDALLRVPVRIVDERIHTETPGLEVLRLAPAASARLEFLPRLKGRVEFACTIEGHREAGMRGVLEIR